MIWLILGSVSCKSRTEEDAVSPVGKNSAFSQCKVGQNECYGNDANLTLLTSDSKGNPEYQFLLSMNVNKSAYHHLSVIISLTTFGGKGTYALTGSNAEIQYVERVPSGQYYESTKVNGTLEITDYQTGKWISGTFAIKSTNGKNTLDLTEGKFRVEADF